MSATDASTADSGAKRKSSEDITHNCNANFGAENGLRKRVKSEEPVGPLKMKQILKFLVK
uniref:Uncharacterized protein n=1 Tax=Drosophila melanogaster TaxID=7227 RepID=Q9XZ64_DROME|nr:unknown [Drosophila melanogaster]